MKKPPAVSGRLLSATWQYNINIRMIARGTDQINIIVGINNADFTKMI